MTDGMVEVLGTPDAIAVRPETRAESGALQAFGGDESYALANMSEAQFGSLVQRMKLHDDRMRVVKESLMEYGVHYGVPGKAIGELKPGDKHGIYKPGVELLLSLYGLVADVQITTHYGDPENVASPALIVDARCLVHRGSLDGPVVAVGVASRNSWEVKYRWRNLGRACPSCGKPALMLSRFAAKGGPFKGAKPWWCNPKAAGCGAEFDPNDARIVSQVTGKIANPDAYDLALALTKMAAKSARADGAITATRSSNLWTQDLEDIAPTPRVNEADVEVVIGEMYGEPAPEPRAHATKAAAVASAASHIDATLKRLRSQLVDVENAYPGRRAYVIDEGVWYVVGAPELGVIGVLAGPGARIQLDYLKPEQMMQLGMYLKDECKRKVVTP